MFRIENYQTPDGIDIVGDWLEGLTDHQAVARIAARLVRLELGNFGDCSTVTKGVWELRIGAQAIEFTTLKPDWN